ncbi:hypothetical protein F5Y04DRAFT_291798 [Hypomontagnella monticulosa]|nr:hypothetical protein F5Y04DRAFT_291798 [Hypomontagnella monticulosa]
MFDVIWTDPNRELMGDKILRKEQEAKVREEKRLRTETSRQSISTESSTSSNRSFGIFSARGRKKNRSPSKSKDSDISPTLLVSSSNKLHRTSEYRAQSLLLHQDDSKVTVKPTVKTHLPVQFPEAADTLSPSSPDSTLSKWTQPSTVTNSTGIGTPVSDTNTSFKQKFLVQTLGPSSFVTKTTEVAFSFRDPDTDIDGLVSDVCISADRTKAPTPPIPDLPERATALAFDDPGSLVSPSESPRTPPPIESRNSTLIYTPGWNDNDRLGNPDAWKPPHEWDCAPTKDIATQSDGRRLHNSLVSDDSDQGMSPGLIALQREIRMMAAASPELTLANIKSSMGHASDATVYKELEMNKKRWMFSALQHEGYDPLAIRTNGFPGSSDSSKSSKPPRILALYESQASASFLAALHPQTPIFHLSPKPISPSLFPNVHPILVPAISASAASRTLAPQLYSTVTCLHMPALFASTEIPVLLRHIYRCLIPGGTLQLTIIDPQPVSSSMGPKLRQWLFDKLLVQLEQECRTTYPSGTFPAWLAVAKLRGHGSTLTTVSVNAVHERAERTRSTQSPAQHELRCLVTRMLWQEIWGRFVQAERWWWEEEDIIQECIEMGTFWQYSHIVAVKGKRRVE